MSKKPYIEKRCEICGRMITTRKDKPSKTCSKDCMAFLRADLAGVNRKCEFCGNIFRSKKKKTMYCSAKCSHSARSKPVALTCEICGAEFIRPPCHATGRRYCSKECKGKAVSIYQTGENSNNWNGGTRHGDGYLFRRTNGTYKGEHRLIMEKHMGRKLRDDEIIHHIDGNKMNNVVENLEIVSRSQHIDIHRDALYVGRRARRAELEVGNVSM